MRDASRPTHRPLESLTGLPKQLRVEVGAAIATASGAGSKLVRLRPMGGGCVNNASAVETESGDRYFLKWNEELAGVVFAREAEGLEALRETRSLRVPRVFGSSQGDATPGWILMELVPRGRPGPSYWASLARGMATLHRPTGEPYGWPRVNYIASLPQNNEPDHDWGRFWTELRIKPQLETAQARGLVDPDRAPWPALLEALPHIVTTRSSGAASLLHGDLWSGNVFPDERGNPVLVDPAVYRGDGAVDLSMAELFGGFPEEFFAAYRVECGVRSFDPILQAAYQLYPLLVHVNLFGASYVGSAIRTAERVAGAA
jgi:fructosamine-3-kinase